MKNINFFQKIGLLAPLFFLNISYAEDVYHPGSNETMDIHEIKLKSDSYSKIINKKNTIFDNDNKIKNNEIEYIKAESYNYGEHDWIATDDYRVISKYPEVENAYAISSISQDYLGILYLSKYKEDAEFKNRVISKGTAQITAYFLHCNKEQNKNIENEYYSYSYDQVLKKTIQMKVGDYGMNFYKNELDLICQHSYVDRTNETLNQVLREWANM